MRLPRTSSTLLDPLAAMTSIGLEAVTTRYRGPLTTTVEAEAHYHDQGDRWPEDVDWVPVRPRPRAPLSARVLAAFDADRVDDEEEVF